MRTIFSAALLAACAATAASASTMALEVTDTSQSWHWSGATIGWQFTTSSDLTITELGVWDQFGDGLADSHQVGIFSTAGALLVSDTVAAGTSEVLEGEFRWSDIPDYLLSAGTYVIGAYMPTSGDQGAARAVGSFAPEVTYDRNLFLYGSGFTLPTIEWVGFDIGNLGPNFKFESASVAPVPLPASSLLLMGGVAALVSLKRKKSA